MNNAAVHIDFLFFQLPPVLQYPYPMRERSSTALEAPFLYHTPDIRGHLQLWVAYRASAADIVNAHCYHQTSRSQDLAWYDMRPHIGAYMIIYRAFLALCEYGARPCLFLSTLSKSLYIFTHVAPATYHEQLIARACTVLLLYHTYTEEIKDSQMYLISAQVRLRHGEAK